MQYDLVFEGGGAKGMVFVGAMQEFESRQHTYKRLLGTSAGAITAALLAAGYTAQEMQNALGEQENGSSVFNGFMASPGPFEQAQVAAGITLSYLRETNLKWLPDFLEDKFETQLIEWLANHPKMCSVYSLMEFGGWFKADNFIRWMERRLDSGENNGKPRRYSRLTLAQFFAETGRELTVIASDTTAGAMLVLNHRTAPDLPLVRAVRMSMSIPLLWQEVIWEEPWGKYRGKEMTGHAIVDGGLLSNFPIELFISQASYVKALMGPEAGEGVLGMRIDESLALGPEPETLAAPKPKGLGDAPLLTRLSNLMNTTLSARDKLVSEEVAKMVVHLPAKGYGTTEFDMSEEKRARLVSAGCDAMKAYFDSLELQQIDGGVSFDIESVQEQAREEERLQRHANHTALKILSE